MKNIKKLICRKKRPNDVISQALVALAKPSESVISRKTTSPQLKPKPQQAQTALSKNPEKTLTSSKFNRTRQWEFMTISSSSIKLSFIFGSIFAFWATGARAASLFSFSTNFSYLDTSSKDCSQQTEKCDIALNSVTIGTKTYQLSEIGRVTDVALLNNYKSESNTGGASLDRGDLATGIVQESLVVENNSLLLPQFNTSADEQAIAQTLGNQNQSIFNLNNIIDTEDEVNPAIVGQETIFTMDLLFNKGTSYNSLLFWERGMNSDILLQPIYQVANNQATEIGEDVFISKTQYDAAGFQIDTTEIDAPQAVGSKGVSFDKEFQGVRIISQKQFDSPDFKIAAVKKTIPEPRMVLGLGLLGAFMLTRCRCKPTKSF